MTRRAFQVRVERVKSGSEVESGLTHEPTSDRVLVGRSTDNTLCLRDPTISSRHLDVWLSDESGWFVVQNKSRNGTTVIGGERLRPDARKEVERERFFVQLGRVLLAVALLPETVPVDEIMTVPSQVSLALQKPPSPPPILRLRRFEQHIEIHCCGHPVPLYPSASRLLARLCDDPGELVAYTDLAMAVDPEFFERSGGTNVAQLVTYIRTMFDKAIEDEALALSVLRKALARVVAEDASSGLEVLDRRGLLRTLVENVRGVGYALRLPSDEIVVEEI